MEKRYVPDKRYNQRLNHLSKTEEKNSFIGVQLFFWIGLIILIIGIVVFVVLLFPSEETKGKSCLNNSNCDDNDPCTINECSSKTGICYFPKKTCSKDQKCNTNTGNCESVQRIESIDILNEIEQPIYNESQNQSEEQEEEQEDEVSDIISTPPPLPPLSVS